MRVANTHGCAVIVSGMPLPPARPARTSWRASRLYTAEQDGQTASRRLPQATGCLAVEGGQFAGGQVDHVGAAAKLDRVRAAGVGGELAFPAAEVRARGRRRCRRRSPPIPSRMAVRDRERLSRRSRCLAPALLGGLAGDAEPGADLGPGIPEHAQACHGLADRGIDLLGETGHGDERVDVAVRDTAGVGPQDAASERGIVVVLDQPPRPFRCQRPLDGVLARRAGRPSRRYPGPRRRASPAVTDRACTASGRMAGLFVTRLVHRTPGEKFTGRGPERRALSGSAPPASTVLRIPLCGTRLRRAVDPGATADPAGLTARARPEARPDRRTANLGTYQEKRTSRSRPRGLCKTSIITINRVDL